MRDPSVLSAALLAVSFLAVDAYAAPQQPGVRIARTQVRATIDGTVATTTIEQTFRNDGAAVAEAIWLLPLPENAVADGLTMRVGDKELAAEVVDADQARSIYESIVRRRRDPALLEYAGDRLLQARVFPIPPQGEVALQVRLRQELRIVAGLGEWQIPLRALRLGERNDGPIGVDVTVRSGVPLRTVFSSRRDAEVVHRAENEARVSFELGPKDEAEPELQVLFGLAETEFGLHALAHRPAGGNGWFSMFVSPRRSLPRDQVPPRCVQFVIDTSGSMRGDKLETAKKALHAFLASLQPIDRFQIVPFATEAQPFFAEPRRADADALADAARRVDALTAQGGTNIGDALAAALNGAAGGPPDEVSLCVFVTDGQPSIGVTNPQQLVAWLKRLGGKTRLFTVGVGVGQDVNGVLLDDLASDHRGTSDRVRASETIDRVAAAICARLREPALTDVTVSCDVDGFEVLPRAIPDLFAGDTLHLVGRYRGTGTHEVVLRGTLAGAERQFRFPVPFPEVETSHDFVRVAWAQRHVQTLLGEIRRNGPHPELVGELTQLAREYGIATPYTSQLIVEDSVRIAGSTPGTGRPVGANGGPAAFGPGGPAGPGRAAPTLPSPSGPSAYGPGGPAAPAPESSTSEYFLGSTRQDRTARDRSGANVATRRAAGRTFLQRFGGGWIEAGLTADQIAKCRRVVAFSDEYFALLAAHPELLAAFALGSDVILRVGDAVLAIAAEP